MERTQVLELMSTLKLYGMRSAYDEVMGNGIKRQHEPPHIVGDLLPPGVSTTAEAAPPTAAMVGRAWLARVPGAAEGMAAVLPIYGRAPDATRWQDGGRGSGASGGGT